MSTQELEKGFSAMPSDVRKASGLPKDECHHEFKLARLRLANLRRREKDALGKAKPFRTSGGQAAPPLTTSRWFYARRGQRKTEPLWMDFSVPYISVIDDGIRDVAQGRGVVISAQEKHLSGGKFCLIGAGYRY